LNWGECLQKSVKERTSNPEQARSLLRMSRIRLEDNERRERTEENISLIVEGYWEVIKQLTTALLNLNGFKSYSQDCLIVFLDEFYDYNQSEVELMDQLRRLRNDIDYRGEFLDIEYLERNEESINAIIQKLDDKVEEKL
jgi:N-acyl-D-aspartate/D-glutamate deacylase